MAVASHASEAMRMTTKLVKVVVYATFALLIGLVAGYSIFYGPGNGAQLRLHVWISIPVMRVVSRSTDFFAGSIAIR
jgi:hypothetical protein